jgi:hypothetical protein
VGVKEIRDSVVGLDVHRDTVVACARIREGRAVHLEKASFASQENKYAPRRSPAAHSNSPDRKKRR